MRIAPSGAKTESQETADAPFQPELRTISTGTRPASNIRAPPMNIGVRIAVRVTESIATILPLAAFRRPVHARRRLDVKKPRTNRITPGQNVRNARIPKPTGFGFGSLVSPRFANRITTSSGPLPHTSRSAPTRK
jgi:hypothetical protein